MKPVLLDPLMLIPAIGLFGISLSLIMSTTPENFVNQLLYFVIGLALFVFISFIDLRIWKKFRWWLYLGSIFFLLLSFLSPAVRGSNRWIDLGFTALQPSELIKPVVLLIFASFFEESEENRISSQIKIFLLFIPIILLIFKQPDLGNVLVYLITYISLLYVNGFRMTYLFISGIISGFLIPLFWFILQQYQKSRLLTFLNPHADPAGAGYNALQSIIALGSGQLFGQGLGRGTQSHLLFLPEYHTDFVFASLVEELGFIGGVVVIIFYLIILFKILNIGLVTKDKFGRLICIGVFIQLFIQVFINIGMNLGILPITGITLPLLSFGGSSVISTFIELGLVMSVARLSRLRNPIEIK